MPTYTLQIIKEIKVEYKDLNKLSEKLAGVNTEANELIREALKNLPEGKALRMKDLADEVLRQCPDCVKGDDDVDKRGKLYVRISAIFTRLQKAGVALKKALDGQSFTWIVRVPKQVETNVSEVEMSSKDDQMSG